MVDRTSRSSSRSSRSSRDEEEDDNPRGARSSSRGGRGREEPEEDTGRGRSSRGREDTGRGSSRGGSSYKYTARDPSAAHKRSQQSGGDFDKYIKDGIKMYKPADGDNQMRVLPPTWENPEHFGLDIFVHFGIGPDQQAYLCAAKMKGEECPICDERKVAIADGDEKYADEIRPVKRVLIALIDRDHEKEGPQVWSMPWSIDRDLIKLTSDSRSGEVLNIDDPENGFDIEFSKSGTGIKTKYVGLAVARRESSLGNDKWLEFMEDNPLPDMLNYYSYEHIAKVFGGASSKSSGSSSRRESAEEVDRSQRRDLDKLDKRDSGRTSRGREQEDELTWEGLHEMTFEELSAIVDDKNLSEIDPEDSEDDEELADWICEDLNIQKKSSTKRSKVEDEDDSTSSKLAAMRNKRKQVD